MKDHERVAVAIELSSPSIVAQRAASRWRISVRWSTDQQIVRLVTNLENAPNELESLIADRFTE